MTVEAGKHSRNRWRATTGPPQTLRRQAQRLSRFGGRAARSGRPDDEEVAVVVGGAVGGSLKVTWRGRPRCLGGGAQTGGACATGRPLRGGLAGSVSVLCRGRRRSATTAAAHHLCGQERNGPAAAPLVVLPGLGPRCVAPALVGGRS